MMHMLAAQAGNTVNFDDDKLKLLGWAGRRAAAALAAPGQPRTLEAPRQGDGWVFLDLPACLRAGLLTPSNERQIGTHRQAPRQNPRGMMPCIMCTS